MRKIVVALLLVLAFSSVFVVFEPCVGVSKSLAISTPDNISTSISQTTTQLAIPTLVQDNFDDDIFNSSIWEKIEVNGGVVTEKDGRL